MTKSTDSNRESNNQKLKDVASDMYAVYSKGEVKDILNIEFCQKVLKIIRDIESDDIAAIKEADVNFDFLFKNRDILRWEPLTFFAKTV